MNTIRRYPILAATLAQLMAGVVTFGVALLLAGRVAPGTVMLMLVAVQALLAAGLSFLLRLQVWWLWIALVFPVALGLALHLGDLPAWPFAAGFALLYLFFSNTARERVPLYLSNRQTAQALCQLMRDRGANRFIDLGCGFGGVVRTVAGDGHTASGVETAPMAFLIARALSALTRRGKIIRQDLWTVDLSGVDVVYAFLSTEPMPALYRKAQAEMKPGSLLVSNSFAVEGIEPQEVWELPDRRRTQLFLYRMG
jgi:SAM-dependent methyltransferase